MDEAWIEQAIGRYQRMERLLADFDKALAKVDVTVRSPDGLVEVIVGADGAIRDVVISEQAQGRSPRDLSKAVQAWMSARQLKGPVPMDEGPVLEPSGKPSEPGMDLGQRLPAAVAGAVRAGRIRAALRTSNPLLVALDRPNREVVVPVRSDVATTFQALELTNGATLDQTLKAASTRLVAEVTQDPAEWVEDAYLHALARKPTEMEKKAALEALGQPVKPEGIADVLWALSMLPEFQLVN